MTTKEMRYTPTLGEQASVNTRSLLCMLLASLLVLTAASCATTPEGDVGPVPLQWPRVPVTLLEWPVASL